MYEVVTEYQTTSTASLTNYPHIFLQLHEGQIINVEEIVIADSTVEDIEGEVVREVRSLISDPPPEGWVETEERMVYHTNESKWGSEGVLDDEMRRIKQQHACKKPTNADCVKYHYEYEEVDDPKIPDHLYYRHC